MNGIVVRLMSEKGFGFIKDPKTNIEYFFHRSACKNVRFDELEEGREVTFEDVDADRGPRAEDIYV